MRHLPRDDARPAARDHSGVQARVPQAVRQRAPKKGPRVRGSRPWRSSPQPPDVAARRPRGPPPPATSGGGCPLRGCPLRARGGAPSPRGVPTGGRSMACALVPDNTPPPSALQVHPKVAQELRRAELSHMQGPRDRVPGAGRPGPGRRREHGRRSAAVGQHGGRAMVAHLTKPDGRGWRRGGEEVATVRGNVPVRGSGLSRSEGRGAARPPSLPARLPHGDGSVWRRGTHVAGVGL